MTIKNYPRLTDTPIADLKPSPRALELRSANRKAPLIVSYDGGLNSLAVIILFKRWNLRPDFIAFSDTGGEKPETYYHMHDVLTPYLDEIGFPPWVRIKKETPSNPGETLESECLRRGELPSRAFGFSKCAVDWKVRPLNKWLKQLPEYKTALAHGTKPIKVLGYDGGEPRRAVHHEDEFGTQWYPLLEAKISRPGCLALIKDEGLPPPPKSACFFCPSSSKSEVLALGKDHPELLARAIEIERVALNGDKPIQVKGLGRHWSWADLLKADKAKRKLMVETIEPCMICADESDE